MADRVLVTGISGFIGGHVALQLLNAGYQVRGSIRNLGRAEEVRAMLRTAGADVSRLEIVSLDLLQDDGWRDAMAGCRYLQHVASPFLIELPKDRDELIRPAVEGTRRAIEAALEADVERIVLTSSGAAVQYGHPPGRTEPFTEADWSATEGHDVTSYTESKTRAELAAWSLVEAAGRRHDLAVINPNAVIGPLLSADPGTSVQLVLRLIDGTMPAAPRIGIGMIDVRDVAALHVAAMTSPEAGGHRHLASAGWVFLYEAGQMIRPAFPQFQKQLPRFQVPDWMVRALQWADKDLRSNIRSLGVIRRIDSSRAEALLGRPFITPRVALAASVQSLIDHGLAPPKKG